jgi:hypothetical protein
MALAAGLQFPHAEVFPVNRIRTISLVALVALVGLSRPSFAQSTDVTNADVQRLQDAIYDASRDVAQLRGSDANLASQLQSQLDDLRDEATYFRVKLRRNEPISRSDYDQARDRVERIRSRARGYSSDADRNYPRPSDRDTRSGAGDRDRDYPRYPAGTVARTGDPNAVPAGTEFDVRLERTLSSETAQPEDRFEATTIVDLRNDDRVLVPAGSTMRGVITTVQRPGHIERKGSLTVMFDQIRINGRTYPIHGVVEQALESGGYKDDAGKIGAGAGVGAILGAILGGAKGALAGILVGGGGVVAATEGKDVTLPAGTVLRVRLDSDLVVARSVLVRRRLANGRRSPLS